MCTPPVLDIAHTISTSLLTGAVHAEVSGGIATGKSLLAARVAQTLAHTQARPVWLVAENEESARHSTSLTHAAHGIRASAPQDGRLEVLTVEDYLESITFGAKHPRFAIFDDADRYDLEPAAHDQQTSTLTCSTAALPQTHEPGHHLTHTRTREEIRRTLEVVRLPGIATTGQPTRHILYPNRPSARRLCTAVNGWGVACVPVHKPLTTSAAHPQRTSSNDSAHLFRRAEAIIRSLMATTVDKLSPTGSAEPGAASLVRAPKVAVTISTARSGRGRRIAEAEAALSINASLLEDLAADPPDVVIVVDPDSAERDDPDHPDDPVLSGTGPQAAHLARLLSIPSIGAVVVTSTNSPTHQTFSQRVLDL